MQVENFSINGVHSVGGGCAKYKKLRAMNSGMRTEQAVLPLELCK